MPNFSFWRPVVSVALTRVRIVPQQCVLREYRTWQIPGCDRSSCRSRLLPSQLTWKPVKFLGTLIYSPTLMAVQGNYDQVNSALFQKSSPTHTVGVLVSTLTCAPTIPKAQNTWLAKLQNSYYNCLTTSSPPCFWPSKKIYKGSLGELIQALVSQKRMSVSAALRQHVVLPSPSFHREDRDFVKPVKQTRSPSIG